MEGCIFVESLLFHPQLRLLYRPAHRLSGGLGTDLCGRILRVESGQAPGYSAFPQQMQLNYAFDRRKKLPHPKKMRQHYSA